MNGRLRWQRKSTDKSQHFAWMESGRTNDAVRTLFVIVPQVVVGPRGGERIRFALIDMAAPGGLDIYDTLRDAKRTASEIIYARRA